MSPLGYPRHIISLPIPDLQNVCALVGLASPKKGTQVCSRGCVLNNLIPLILLKMRRKEKCAVNLILEDCFIL